VLAWRSVSSELFANLFEDWMRGDRRVAWVRCDSSTINWGVDGHPGSRVRVDLLPEASAGSVRERAYALFEQGLDQRLVPPPVRKDLFGPCTAHTLDVLRSALERVRSEQ